MTCDRCNRDLIDEDAISTPDGRWLCEPCNAEMGKAEQRSDSIDAAWASVEALLPKGWGLGGLAFMGASTSDYPRDLDGWWEAWAIGAAGGEDLAEYAYGYTPAQALRSLGQRVASELGHGSG